jgi:hypothetical protein
LVGSGQLCYSAGSFLETVMKSNNSLLHLLVGVALGGGAVFLGLGSPRSVEARPGDRFEDTIICTGACAITPRSTMDGVWLLDYRTGKLMGTVIDRNVGGKIVGWAEVDLASEFNIAPKSNAHFIMTTGTITAGQAALYIAELTTGKFGVYTMGPDAATMNGASIRRHDLVMFRKG